MADGINTRLIHAIGFGQRNSQRRVTGELQNSQMLAGLRHHAIVAGHHQQRMVDTAHTCEHIGQKLLVARHINKAWHTAIRLRPVGIAKIDGHTARFLFRQTVSIHAGNGL